MNARNRLPPVAFRDEEIELKLADRATYGPFASAQGRQPSLGLVAKRELRRYYALLERSLLELKGRFTVAELALILDVTNGTLWHPAIMGLLWLQVHDGIELDGLDVKWDVDADTLRAKLMALTLPQAAALVDACERYWCRPEPRHLTRETFEGLGLVPAQEE